MASERVLSLPIFPTLLDAEVEMVIDAITNAMSKVCVA